MTSFHVLFAKHNYHFVFAPYGVDMGVGLAFPLSKYTLMHVDMSKIADTGFLQHLYTPFPSLPSTTLCSTITMQSPNDYDWIQMSRKRENRMIMMRVQTKDTLIPFCIGVYHMPCVFSVPSVMVCHTALAMQHAQRFAKGDPLVICGDWNSTPVSESYQLITQGVLPDSHPCAIKATLVCATQDVSTSTWTCTLDYAMKSACMEALGREPDFTNNARKKNDYQPFLGVLDYIFLSDHWIAQCVDDLPSLDLGMKGVFPNEYEPSDHVLLAVKVILKSGA